jgi:23S rRNA (pseudouridine1915-N3)-methyltransferase
VKINVISIESSRPEWAEKAFRSYESKFNKSIRVNWIGLKPLNRNRNYNNSAIVEKESELLFSKIKKKDFVIALDKQGMELSTEKLRVQFDNWVSGSRDISMIIGGPDGLSETLLKKSDFCWSLSSLTFPHSFVPILIIEQIYRVWSITQNHPYHK